MRMTKVLKGTLQMLGGLALAFVLYVALFHNPVVADYRLWKAERDRLFTPSAEANLASKERNFQVICPAYRDATFMQKMWTYRNEKWCEDYLHRL